MLFVAVYIMYKYIGVCVFVFVFCRLVACVLAGRGGAGCIGVLVGMYILYYGEMGWGCVIMG